jgi:hypothetical protein
VLLPVAVASAGYCWIADRGVYHWFVALAGDSPRYRLIGVGLTLVAHLLFVAFVGLILRPFVKDMPPLRAQMRQGDAAAGLATPKQRKQAMASVKVALGIAFGILAGASRPATGGVLYEWQIVLLLLGAGLVLWGAIELVLIRRP